MARLKHKLRLQSEAQNHRCCFCGKVCWIYGLDEVHGRTQDQATFEHVVPQSDGGKDSRSNCAMACMACNTTRGNMNAYKFFKLRGDVNRWMEYLIDREIARQLNRKRRKAKKKEIEAKIKSQKLEKRLEKLEKIHTKIFVIEFCLAA